MNRKLLTLAVATALGGGLIGGCEEKKPAAPTPAPAPAKPSSDATKGAVDAGKEAVAETVDKAKEAAAAISAQAQQAIKDYLGGLGDANSAMSKIKSALDAPQGLAALNDAAKKVNANSAVLGALPAAEQTAVKDANKDQLSSLTAAFNEHVDRLSKDAGVGKVVGDALKSFKLFE